MATFSVTRSPGTLVRPSEETPSGELDLSVIDRIPEVRNYAKTLHVFKCGGAEAASVVREALSKALVPYYPLAGRLRETDDKPIHVVCSGDGVWFVEGTAECSLQAVDFFNDMEAVPYDDLLPDQPPESLAVDPLVLMQVTEFKCGGFVMGLRFSHTICDGAGSAQFLNAVGEIARGIEKLSVLPVWHRDLIDTTVNGGSATTSSKQPPPQSWPPTPPPVADYHLEHAVVDLSPEQIGRLKQEFQEATGGQTCSIFEILAASIWSQRTRVIKLPPDTKMTLIFFANCRQLAKPPPPAGFYGNCFFPVVISASSDMLATSNLIDVVKLIKEGKAKLPEEFTKWMKQKAFPDRHADDGYSYAPPLDYTALFLSVWARLGFNEVDYGWGPPAHVVPVQAQSVAPAAIVGSPPSPRTGFRLATWCVKEAHLEPFLNRMNNLKMIDS